MKCINTGGTLTFGDEQGNTVFMRAGETFDVPEDVYQEHGTGKNARLKAITGKETKFTNQLNGKDEKIDPGKEPEILTGQQRRETTRQPRGGGKAAKDKKEPKE